jgi:hypothetical protein
MLLSSKSHCATDSDKGGSMHRPTLAVFTLSIVLTVAACQTRDPSAPGDEVTRVPTDLTQNADAACRYSPAGPVEIHVGTSQKFIPSAGDCTGSYATLSPADGRVGFGTGPSCTVFTHRTATTHESLFSVYRCSLGGSPPTAYLRIYRSPTNLTLLQTITIYAN